MKRGHFERLSPRCPACASRAPLAVLREARGDLASLEEGALVCTHAACRREFPVIDGMPLLVRDLGLHVRDQWTALAGREDLAAETESALGDAYGPGSREDALRQHVSGYAFDHYGEFDPAETERDPAPGSVVRLLEALWSAAGALPSGPVLELGCSVGRATFELARLSGREALGVELHHGKLRLAARVLRTGRVRYARRRVGLVYDRREFPATLPAAERVDFWIADAAALPFAEGTFAAVVALNLLDCAHAPLDVLREAARVLAPGGKLLAATPYDWSSQATPVQHWLGGHSQRGPGGGASEPVLRALLTRGAHPQSIEGLELARELDGLPWHVRLHDRSSVRYRCHGVIATRA